MRRVILSSIAAIGFLSAGEVSAQALFDLPEPGATPQGRAARYRAPAAGAPAAGTPVAAVRPVATAQGQYGGGFIELLMTGREPIRPVRPDPLLSEPGFADEPHDREPQGRAARAALPGAPDGGELGLGRAIDPRFRRQVVSYDGPHGPGTIVIDTPAKHLYLVQPGGTAVRYGIGVGRPGFTWAGMKAISRKAEWPGWTPPPEMLKRRPDLPRHMAGGPENPLGARALYLGSSLYRIHGTNEPHTIGHAVSSGCIRMMNEDVVDLYERVRVGTKVLVI